MSVIFPGNYVARLNAYRDQGCFSLPGVEFYQAIGAAVVTADQTGGGVPGGRNPVSRPASGRQASSR